VEVGVREIKRPVAKWKAVRRQQLSALNLQLSPPRLTLAGLPKYSFGLHTFFILYLDRSVPLAKCDQGYLCEVCGEPVKSIVESSLYLRYVLGEVDLHELFGKPERHLQCDCELSGYISDERFQQTVACAEAANGNGSTTNGTDFVERSARITRGWHRLREVVRSDIPITEYPLTD